MNYSYCLHLSLVDKYDRRDPKLFWKEGQVISSIKILNCEEISYSTVRYLSFKEMSIILTSSLTEHTSRIDISIKIVKSKVIKLNPQYAKISTLF